MEKKKGFPAAKLLLQHGRHWTWTECRICLDKWARWLLPSCQNEGPKIFELTGTSASASLYLMLSPGGKCCLSQSCKNLKSPRDPLADYSLKIQKMCKASQYEIWQIWYHCPAFLVNYQAPTNWLPIVVNSPLSRLQLLQKEKHKCPEQYW